MIFTTYTMTKFHSIPKILLSSCPKLLLVLECIEYMCICKPWLTIKNVLLLAMHKHVIIEPS